MKNLILLSVFLAGTALLAGPYAYNYFQNDSKTIDSSANSLYVVDRAYLKSSKSDSDLEFPNSLTYQTEIKLSFNENQADGYVDTKQSQNITMNTVAHINYTFTYPMYYLTIGFSQIKMEQDGDKSQNQTQEAPSDDFLIYKVQVDDDSGRVYSIEATKNSHTAIIDWSIQELVNNIIPDLRKSTFEQQVPWEYNGIGVYTPTVSYNENKSYYTFKKEYDNTNYSSYHILGINPPSSIYTRQIKVSDDGVVYIGSTIYKYGIGEQQLEDDQTPTDYLTAQFLTNFELNEETYQSQQFVKEMLSLKDEQSFENISLANNPASYTTESSIFEGELNTTDLSQQQETVLLSVNILGQNVRIFGKSIYTKENTLLKFSLYASVNNFVSTSIRDFQAEKTQSPIAFDFKEEIEKTLLTAQWQLTGFFTLPIKIGGIIDTSVQIYGRGTSSPTWCDRFGVCEYSTYEYGGTKIFTKLNLKNEGRVQIPCAAEVGIFSEGTFLDSTTTMYTEDSNKFNNASGSYQKTEQTLKSTIDNEVLSSLYGLHSSFQLDEMKGTSWQDPLQWCEKQNPTYYPLGNISVLADEFNSFNFEEVNTY